MDGDGGDENLKDYPIEENSELTIRSVVNNRMLYQEGWGVESIKHSLTYSGGYSRGCVRSYACAREYGFEAFSPYTRPSVIAVAEAIPFAALTEGLDRAALRAQGRDRRARHSRGARRRDAGLSEAPVPARLGLGGGASPRLFPAGRGALPAALRDAARRVRLACRPLRRGSRPAGATDRRIRSLRRRSPSSIRGRRTDRCSRRNAARMERSSER